MTPRILHQPFRLDPFQNIVNFSWGGKDFLVITAPSVFFRTTGTTTLKNFNIPSWAGVEIPLYPSPGGTIWPSGAAATITDDYVAKPGRASAWVAPTNGPLSDIVFGGTTSHPLYSGNYAVIDLAAASGLSHLTFDYTVTEDGAPPEIPATVFVPLEILYTDALATWGTPIGNPAWPLAFYGPVLSTSGPNAGSMIYIYSDTPGTGGTYSGPETPTPIQKEVAEGLWGVPPGNPNWPPLFSLTPVTWTGGGPLNGLMVYLYLGSTGGLAAGSYGCILLFNVVRGLKKVFNPPTSKGVAYYAPPIPPSATPAIVRDWPDAPASVAHNDSKDYCVAGGGNEITFAIGNTTPTFQYWGPATYSSRGFGNINCLLTGDYISLRVLGTTSVTVDLKTFAISSI